jgi:hypothetical protein
MEGKYDRFRKSMRCQSLRVMEVKLSVLPQAYLALSSTNRHTLNNRMAGCQIHIGLLSVKFLSVCSCVLYVAYIVIVCIINFFLGTFTFIYDIGNQNCT